MIKSPKHLAEYYLKSNLKKLTLLADNADKHYNVFTKKKIKPDGTIKEREITEAIGELRAVHDLIFRRIISKIEFPSPPFIGGLKKRDNILNAYFHQGKPYKFCTDLKNFYPHINNRMVYDAFVKQGFSPDVSSLLTKLTTYKGGLIQGGVNSTHIAYLSIWSVVEELSKICDENEIVFTVYVDDLTFSSRKDFKDLSITLRDIVINGGFFINHKKTFFTRGKADITGVKVGQNTLNVKEEFRKKLIDTTQLNENQKKGLQRYYDRVVTYGRKNAVKVLKSNLRASQP